MLYDCFTFNDELDLLELRLRELEDLVDGWVLVEACQTFSGKLKPLHYAEHAARFAPWADRIVHLICGPSQGGWTSWEREAHQRSAILVALESAAATDLAIVSDVDEIPDKQLIRDNLARVAGPYWLGFRPAAHYYALNLRSREQIQAIALASVGAVRHITPQGLRDLRQTPTLAVILGLVFGDDAI